MFDKSYFMNNKLYIEKYEFQYFKYENIDCQKVLHICFNINDEFFKPLGAEITSILETNKDLFLCLYIFVDSYSKENLDNLKKTAEKYKCNIYLYVMDMTIYQNFHIKVKRFSRVTYLRIVMPWIMRNFTKYYLYLDSDMICVGSLKQFMDIDVEGKSLAAVFFDIPDRVEFLKLKNGKYFQDGVMWVNVDEWIKQQVTEKVFSYQGADPSRFKGQTQDLLNIVLDGNIKGITSMFHHPNKDMSIDGILIHYSGRNKPWDIVLDSDDELWRYYLSISFWESLPDFMPAKKAENYYNFREMANYYRKKGEQWKELKCIFWYCILKVKNIFNI